MSGCRKGALALVRELARQETPEAVEALVEIMRDEEAPWRRTASSPLCATQPPPPVNVEHAIGVRKCEMLVYQSRKRRPDRSLRNS
jgi:hypothetical protein